SQIKIKHSVSSSFSILQCVPQGVALSPLLFNLSIECLFNFICSVPSLSLRAYADDTNIIGLSLSDLNLLLSSIFPLYKYTTDGEIDISKSSLTPIYPSTFPSFLLPNNSPPISLSLSTLGFTLPLSPSNTLTLWDNLLSKLKSHASLLSSRNLSLKGRVLISKSLLLSKLWYYATICPPPKQFIKSIQTLINNFIWNSSKTHPSFQVSSLPTKLGGISIPDFKLELKIRHTKLISKTFNPHPPFWTSILDQCCLEHYHKSLTSCLILKQGMKRPIEPLKLFLNSSKLLENLSPSIILSSPTLPELRSILTIPPSPPLIPFSPSSFFPTLSWKEIHHPHYPRKIQDLLWKISHFSLPVGPSVT